MFSLRRPSEATIRSLLDRCRGGSFSYPEVGATRTLSRPSEAPRGYNVDFNRATLGRGAPVFERAVEALRRWEAHKIGWLELFYPDAPMEAGTPVGVLLRVLGVWSLNVNRIVYVIDERAGGARRFGFGYGTLEEHAERGEERFCIEHLESDDSVSFEIVAFSRPNHALTRAGYPLTRALQRRFAADALRSMQVSSAG